MNIVLCRLTNQRARVVTAPLARSLPGPVVGEQGVPLLGKAEPGGEWCEEPAGTAGQVR